MYQWFILVKYQKYINFSQVQKSPLSGGLQEGKVQTPSRRAGMKKPAEAGSFIGN